MKVICFIYKTNKFWQCKYKDLEQNKNTHTHFDWIWIKFVGLKSENFQVN